MMFESVRFKLTAWYLLIIMLVSIFFSAVIYVGMARELERGFRRAELKFRAKELGITLPRRFSVKPKDLPPRLKEITSPFLFVEDLQRARKRLLINLLSINSLILAVSAGAGYFLAGKTLAPIEAAVEEQKRFVADASHELRTPLTALKTSLEVVLRDKRISLIKAKKAMKSNLEDIDELQSLTNSLLNLTNLQSNGQSLVFEDVDIARVVKKASQKILPLAEKKKIKIKLKIKNQTIQANKETLEEMIVIFLDNAVKYTPKKGKITISSQSNKKHLLLEFKDTGIGITKQDLPYIFDRFYRVDQARSRNNSQGFGLGLSLAKRIVEIHKGRVKTISKIGKGTTFLVKFPLKHS